MSIALKISRHKPIIKLFSGFAMIVQAVNTENIPFFEGNCSADLLSATMVSSASDGAGCAIRSVFSRISL